MMPKFFTLGTNYISTSLFFPIKDTLNCSKPMGGLWLTKYYEEYPNFNEWLDFLETKPSYFLAKYSLSSPAAIVTLKNNAQIFMLDSKEKLDYLKQKYPAPNFFSYELLSKDYDGIYFKIFEINDNNIINAFSVNSLILFNLDVIAYYTQAKVMMDSDFLENPESSYTIIPQEKQFKVDNSSIYQQFIKSNGAKIYQYIKQKYPNYVQENYVTLFKYIQELSSQYRELEDEKLALVLVRNLINKTNQS